MRISADRGSPTTTYRSRIHTGLWARNRSGIRWPEAKKLCRLNQREIEMAKRLGFGPDALIRARPDPKQKWKLPVKYWVRELHAKRFGEEPGDRLDDLKPEPLEYDEEAARIYRRAALLGGLPRSERGFP